MAIAETHSSKTLFPSVGFVYSVYYGIETTLKKIEALHNESSVRRVWFGARYVCEGWDGGRDAAPLDSWGKL